MNVKLLINPQRIVGPVDSGIFGSFIENINDCIYGGVYDPECPTASEEGFRRDVMAAARAMGVSVVRFPGGCFAPFYHWQDGVGPREKRPLTRYQSTGEWPTSNQFGTDEFVSWCRQIDAEPYICVNMGSGTPEEARNWVEYCNGEAGSRWADLRIANGHPEPYRVRYWALGNELSNHEFGHAPTPDDYIRRARDFAKGMKLADPAIKLIFCGSHFPLNHRWLNWNRDVLDQLFDDVDYISMHHYIGLMGRSYCGDGKWKEMGALATHLHLTEYMGEVEDACRLVREDIRLAKHRHGNLTKKIGLALDEYNPWYRSWEGNPAGSLNLCESYSLSDALLGAAYFNIFLRNADVLTLANMAQLVNVLPALVARPGTTEFYRQTISFVQELYQDNRNATAVDVWIQSPSFGGAFYPAVSWLDASATLSSDRNSVMLNLINRHPDQAMTLDVEVLDREIERISGRQLGGGDLDAVNDFAVPDRISLRPVSESDLRKRLVPPLSVTVFRLTLKA